MAGSPTPPTPMPTVGDILSLTRSDIGHVFASSLAHMSASQSAVYSTLESKLRARAPVRIVALGGSMQAGTTCKEREVQGRACSYTARFAAHLDSEYRVPWMPSLFHTRFLDYSNRAVGGTTTAGALPSLLVNVGSGPESDEPPDWILIDFSENDAHETPDESATSAPPVTADRVFAASEAMLRFLLRRFPLTALLVIETACPIAPRTRRTAEAHRRAATAYGVPFTSYAQWLTNCSWCAWGGADPLSPHPPWTTHEAIAQFLLRWWHVARRPDARHASQPGRVHTHLRSPIAPLKLAAQFDVCEVQRASFDARAAAHGRDGAILQPILVQGEWPLRVENYKAGWTTTGPANSTLDFPLSFGASPRVTLVIERSYEGFGDVVATMHGAGASPAEAIVTGMHAERVTQTFLVVMDVARPDLQQRSAVGDYDTVHKGFAIRPWSNATLRLRYASTPPAKFKVRSVSSC